MHAPTNFGTSFLFIIFNFQHQTAHLMQLRVPTSTPRISLNTIPIVGALGHGLGGIAFRRNLSPTEAISWELLNVQVTTRLSLP